MNLLLRVRINGRKYSLGKQESVGIIKSLNYGDFNYPTNINV